jgi:hypothetical protein
MNFGRPTCCGIGWVCEKHPDKAFDDCTSSDNLRLIRLSGREAGSSGLEMAEVDVGRCEVVDALMIADMIVMFDAKAAICRSNSPGR